jgi:hypothetical protein
MPATDWDNDKDKSATSVDDVKQDAALMDLQ